MDQMFWYAEAFNQDLGWCVHGSTINLFRKTGCTVLRCGVNYAPCPYVFISKSELETAVDMWTSTSSQASALATYGEIEIWDVSAVDDMAELFLHKTGFNDDITGWDVSSVTTMSGMFRNTPAFNQPIGVWDVSSLTRMDAMFRDSAFNQDISAWDVCVRCAEIK